jgi:predicted ArsR family transcriptional regulator
LSAANRRRSTLAQAAVRLTPRDLALLEDLAELRLASLDQLAARHFAGLTRKTALNKLSRLVRGGYLTRSQGHLFNRPRPTALYTLTPAGRQAVEQRTLFLQRS